VYGKIGYLMRQLLLGLSARSSRDYWERRYQAGLTSGSGSYGELATFKAEVLDGFVQRHGIGCVAEFGCGDGNQLSLAHYPRYLGFDVSQRAVELCRQRFATDGTKSFHLYEAASSARVAREAGAELSLSLDVIYHVLEDDAYHQHLRDLFDSASRFVIIYSSDREEPQRVAHVRHRKFTSDVQRDHPEFRLVEHVPNRHPDHSFAEFFIFERLPAGASTGQQRPRPKLHA
jgi:hypothetical protein